MKKQWWTSRALSIGVSLFFLMYIDVVPKMAETSNQARTNLQVVVTGIRKVAGRNQTGPVVGAQVLVKSEVQDEDFEVSTDSQGVANVSNVPRGSVLIQVTAQGWISAGMRHELTKKEQTVKIEMKAEEGPSPSPTPSTTPSPSPSPSPTPSANV